MKKFIAITLIIALFVVAAVTCPRKDDHAQKLSQVVNQSVKNAIKDHAGSEIAVVSSILTGGIVKGVVGEMIDVDNYLFFSLGKMNLPTESKIVSVGFFNQVLTVDSKALSEAIEKKAGGAFNSLFKD